MTTEQLLQPRFILIADYPDSPFKKDEPINLELWPVSQKWGALVHGEKHNTIFKIEFFTSYPHLFRKLKWWEYRKPGEQPKFLKYYGDVGTGLIVKRVNWIDPVEVSFSADIIYDITHWLPATEQEYLNYVCP